jgi:DNA polymerase-1
MRLRLDAPCEIDLDGLQWGPKDPAELKRLFDFLEFRSLFERLEEVLAAPIGVVAAAGEVLEPELTRSETPAESAAALHRPAVLDVAARYEGAEGRTPLVGLAVVVEPETGSVVWVPADHFADPAVRAALGDGRPLRAHNAKALLRGFESHGFDLHSLELDTMIAAYLLDPAEARYAIGELLVRYTGHSMPEGATPEGQLDLGGDGVDVAVEAAREALAVSRLAPALENALDKQGMRRLYDEIENPLVRVLARMEAVGVGVDRAELQGLHDRLTAECRRLAGDVYAAAGREFNLNSPPQLRTILFDERGLTPQKRTKTGFSTDAASLERLRDQWPEFIDPLLSYREVEKLRSTYGEGLLSEIAADGRIHATFNQTVARTGRLSSDQPNLHNIPIRSEEGRQFRRAFVPAKGHTLLVADYNQIELRCIAHLAEDPGLIAAFTSRQDIHTATAARIFSVDPDKVTIAQRSKAKMVSYGLAYGMEAYGLGQRLNIPTEEAAEILAAYFEAFPSVKRYMERTVNEARQRGYTETLFGRRRPIPELSSSNYRIRQAGERQAMNAGIQGLAADIFKVALIRLDAALESGGYGSRLILQVHDEVLVEAPVDERDDVLELTRQTLAGAAELRVPLEVNLSWGDSWAESKS